MSVFVCRVIRDAFNSNKVHSLSCPPCHLFVCVGRSVCRGYTLHGPHPLPCKRKLGTQEKSYIESVNCLVVLEVFNRVFLYSLLLLLFCTFQDVNVNIFRRTSYHPLRWRGQGLHPTFVYTIIFSDVVIRNHPSCTSPKKTILFLYT